MWGRLARLMDALGSVSLVSKSVRLFARYYLYLPAYLGIRHPRSYLGS